MWMSIPAAATWTVAVLLGSTHQAQQRDIASLVSPASIVAVSCDDVPALRSALLQNSWFHAFTAPESPFRSMAGPDAREIDEMVAVLSTNRTPEQLAMMDDDAQKIASVLDALRGGAGFWVVMPDDFEGNPVMGVLLRTDAATNELVSRISAWIAESEEKEAVAEPFRGSDWMRIDSQRDTLTLVGGLEGFTTLLVGPAERVEAERAALHARITTPGRRGGLHENQRHVEAMRALTVQGQVTVTADLSTLMAFARRSMEADMGTGEDAVAMQRAVDRSGVFRLGWAGMRMGVGAGERAEGEFVLDVPAQTFLAEVLDLMRPIPMALLAMVPKDALAVQAANYDLPGLFDLGLRVADEVYPDAGRMLESMIAMASARMGVDLREELVDLLTGEFVSFVTPRSFAGATTPVAALSAIESIGTMLLGSKDSDALASTMMSLVDSAAMEMGGEFEWEDRDVTGGPTVHVLRGLDVVIGVDPVMAAGPGVLAISVDGSDLAPIVGGRQAESVLDTQLVGRRLKELRQASYAGVIHTSKTLASMVATWSSTFADGEWTRSDLEAYFGTHFSGTSVRTIERRPTYLRFYSGSN